MDKKKNYKEKKKQSLRKNIKTERHEEYGSFSANQIMSYFENMQGVDKVYLSPLTQKIVGCRIGENITADSPWVFVTKEKIEDNMFLHDNSSEFLPIKFKIENYPEPEILLGSYSHIQDKEVDFFVCTAIEVKLNILQIMEEEKKIAFKRIKKALNPAAKPWIDFGSKIEVNGNMNLNNRALLEVKLTTEYPIPQHTINFTMCWADTFSKTYAEVLPGRFPYKLIMKKRIDASTQYTLLKQDKSNQSNAAIQRNKYCQYSYSYQEVEMTEDTTMNFHKFIETKCDLFYETLILNFHINLYEDDYKELAVNYKAILLKDPVELKSYQDVINCKHKKISCVSWNALVSGMLAAAYTITPIFYIGKSEPIHNDPHDSVHEKHLILLWCYMDNVRPKLYIHAYREVTALSFCPYDENILVGGYCNGQIAVWDITNKIAAVESREVLTNLEQEHRQIMAQQTEWIQKSHSVENVFPVLTSSLDISHSSAVTAIKWIPPSHYISNMGKYTKTQSNEKHMQFMTVSLEGSTILIWDLMPQKQEKKEASAPKKKSLRLGKLPETLTKHESPLKEMQHTFVPQYIYIVKDPITELKSPITNIIIKNQIYGYVARNPETVGNIEERTYFNVHESLHPFDDTHKFILSTTLGTMQIATWEGTQYNQGQKINSETCKVDYLVAVHDGPITVCETNPFFDDMLLTVGGSIFAIWNCTKLHVPLIWRKNKVRYISGMWSFRHPLTLFVTRSDTHYEIWNILDRSEGPVRIFKYKGNQLITLFSDWTRLHTRKKTFITTDIVGAFKIFNLPIGILNLKDININESKKYIEHVIAIKEYTEKLKISHKNLKGKAYMKQEDQTQGAQDTESPKNKRRATTSQTRKVEVTDTAINKWQIKQEESMHNILLEKKRLNVEEIEQNRIPMQLYMDEEKVKHSKVKTKILTRDEDFIKIRDTLLQSAESQKIRRKITVSLPKAMTNVIKQKYMESYNKIERLAMQNIKSKKYTYDLDWKKILQHGINTNQSSFLLDTIQANSISPIYLEYTESKIEITLE